jgi:NADPH-dependent ferric siderophore reductase
MLLSDLLPATIAWNPAPGDVVLLAATADDLELVETVLATLPPRSRGQVFVQANGGADPRALRAPGRVCVTWLDADRGQTAAAAADAWLAEMLPTDVERTHRVYAWFSGDRAARTLTNQ